MSKVEQLLIDMVGVLGEVELWPSNVIKETMKTCVSLIREDKKNEK